MTVSLVVTDLDGTLWEVPETTPQVTIDAMAELTRRGLPVLVATGRRLQSTKEPLATLGFAPPAVMLNGAMGIDLASGEHFHRGGFSTDAAVATLAAFRDHGIDPCVYVDRVDPAVYLSPEPTTHRGHVESFGPLCAVADLDEIVLTEDVLAFSVLGIDRDHAVATEATLAAVATPHVGVDRHYGGVAITVAPTNASKWDGVLAFCVSRGIDPTGVLAIGDGPNDVELLDAASVAVCPADAHPAAMAHADHVVGRAADGGWAELLDLV